MSKYKVCELDVWGNEKDGYEVNNWYTTGFITLNDQDDLITELNKQLEYKVNVNLVDVHDEYNGFIEIADKKTGKPLLQLTKENEEV